MLIHSYRKSESINKLNRRLSLACCLLIVGCFDIFQSTTECAGRLPGLIYESANPVIDDPDIGKLEVQEGKITPPVGSGLLLTVIKSGEEYLMDINYSFSSQEVTDQIQIVNLFPSSRVTPWSDVSDIEQPAIFLLREDPAEYAKIATRSTMFFWLGPAEAIKSENSGLSKFMFTIDFNPWISEGEFYIELDQSKFKNSGGKFKIAFYGESLFGEINCTLPSSN